MDTVEQTIANIRARNVELASEGDKIVASEELLPDEQEVLKENRGKAITLINGAPETAEQAHRRELEEARKEAYAAGVQDGLEQAQSSAAVAAPAPPQTTPDEEIEKFEKWFNQKGDYYKWGPSALEKLRAALVPGDKVQGLFAYTCIIIHADGTETEFKRVAERKKK